MHGMATSVLILCGYRCMEMLTPHNGMETGTSLCSLLYIFADIIASKSFSVVENTIGFIRKFRFEIRSTAIMQMLVLLSTEELGTNYG